MAAGKGPGAQAVDLGCGAGIPATRELARHALQVLGADISAVQLRRAQRLVPAARFVQADMAELHLRPATADVVVAFYSLIHVPLADQQALFPRIRDWLRLGGYFLATVGAEQWTGTAPCLGADMFWDHADTVTYLRWLQTVRLRPIWNRYIPKGTAAILASWSRHHERHTDGIPPAADVIDPGWSESDPDRRLSAAEANILPCVAIHINSLTTAQPGWQHRADLRLGG
jgi:SAM-dependent methyltransferase